MIKPNKSNGRKGFSLVELIVVIAIMAVLVAVLAPSLLSYVERSRAQKDESAMGEVTNAVLLALSDQDVYDELLVHSIKNNVSCYIDETLESKLGLDKTVTKEENHNTAEQYTYGDEARLNDEVAYYAAGNMRGVTITFKPSVGTKSTTYTLASGSINKFKENKGAVMQDCPTLYNTVRATVGDTIEQTSQTYRNSEYTIFIKLGSQGGADTAAQDAVQVYGQYSGTNLPAQASEAVNVATDRATGEGTSASTGNGASANLSGKAPVTMNGEATQTFDKGAPADVVFTSPADFSTFKGVAVNGVMISAGTDYTAESGSTIVTLKSSYLKTLANGNYTVMIISEGQYATGTLTVIGESANDPSNAELITFTIYFPDIEEEIEIQAKDGMTVEEFLNSEYNSEGLHRMECLACNENNFSFLIQEDGRELMFELDTVCGCDMFQPLYSGGTIMYGEDKLTIEHVLRQGDRFEVPSMVWEYDEEYEDVRSILIYDENEQDYGIINFPPEYDFASLIEEYDSCDILCPDCGSLAIITLYGDYESGDPMYGGFECYDGCGLVYEGHLVSKESGERVYPDYVPEPYEEFILLNDFE